MIAKPTTRHFVILAPRVAHKAKSPTNKTPPPCGEGKGWGCFCFQLYSVVLGLDPKTQGNGLCAQLPHLIDFAAWQVANGGAMRLSSIRLVGIRCFEDTGDLALSPKCTLFVGSNNSGKSTLLKCVLISTRFPVRYA